MKHELCILFLHHRNDGLSRFHLEVIRENNPDVPVVPLTFRIGVTGATRVAEWNWTVRDEWHANDVMVYSWYRRRNLDAKRYVIFDYDTLVMESVERFYRNVWDADVACARPVLYEYQPDWHWFNPQFVDLLPAELGHHLAGMVPASGSFFSDRALGAIVRSARNKMFSELFCECRLGTLARAAGFQIEPIRDDAERFLSWTEVSPMGIGIWHPVKKICSRVPSNGREN
jgi:hypothetical protein